MAASIALSSLIVVVGAANSNLPNFDANSWHQMRQSQDGDNRTLQFDRESGDLVMADKCPNCLQYWQSLSDPREAAVDQLTLDGSNTNSIRHRQRSRRAQRNMDPAQQSDGRRFAARDVLCAQRAGQQPDEAVHAQCNRRSGSEMAHYPLEGERQLENLKRCQWDGL